MKFTAADMLLLPAPSPPSRGAWIEMNLARTALGQRQESPPSRGAWIEMEELTQRRALLQGRPPRGGRGLKYLGMVYIERGYVVAPLAGGVD